MKLHLKNPRRIPAWKSVVIGGALVLLVGLALPPVLEQIIYRPPPDFKSLKTGTSVAFVGTVKSNKIIPWDFGVAYEIEVEGFDGVISYKPNNFQIGDKVLIRGYYDYDRITGRPPYIHMADGNIPADVSLIWWPSVSQYIMLIGAVLILSGTVCEFIARRKKPTVQ